MFGFAYSSYSRQSDWPINLLIPDGDLQVARYFILQPHCDKHLHLVVQAVAQGINFLKPNQALYI